jgi:hypothetical protein
VTGETSSLDAGTFDMSKHFSMLAGLRELGVDITRLNAGSFHCASMSQLPRCMSQLTQSGLFGRMRPDAIKRQGSDVIATFNGSVSYDWTDDMGAKNHRESRISGFIPLLRFSVGEMAECGGSAPEDQEHAAIKLSLDKRDYRLAIRVSDSIRSGETKRIGIVLDAEKSSQHVFQFVLRTSDGTNLSSPKFSLQMFKPRYDRDRANHEEE